VVDPPAAIAGRAGAWALSDAAAGAPSRVDPDTATTGGAAAPTLTSVPAGAFVAGGCCSNSSENPHTVTGEDVEDDITYIASDGQTGGFVHNLPSTAGTITHSWDDPVNSRIAAIMVEILAA